MLATSKVRRWPIGIAAVLLVSACAGSSGDESSPRGVDQVQECAAPRAGYGVEYPAGWHTNPGTVMETCHWFHPSDFELQPATEAPRIAIHIRMNSLMVDEIVQAAEGSSHVLSRREPNVDGRHAVVLEVESSEVGLVPAGTRSYTYFVDADARTLIASATEAAPGEYDRHKRVLDRMMRSLSFHAPPSTSCSAFDLSVIPEPQPQLPAVVATTRRAIVEAAARCDWAALERLSSSGSEPFTASFGDTPPVSLWQRLETEGRQPMRFLTALFDRSYATRSAGGVVQYVWPSAFSAERWTAVPDSARAELRPLYDEDDFARFAQFGSYTGYRIGISADGEWLFFVGGD